MATFAPDVKETQPSSYLGLSQPITPLRNYSTSNGPDASIDNRSAGTILQGLGNLFDNSVKAGDQIVKKTIEDELYKKIDEKREGYASDLEKAGNIPLVQRVADVAGNQPPQPIQNTQNILPDRPPGPMPTELARLPDTLGNLQSASGKLSPTYYTGRLDLIAKDLRTKYPGYRDYIDKQVESITGENPANMYVKNLLHQINQNSENSRSERDKKLAYLEKNDGLDGVHVMAAKVDSLSMADLIGWASRTKIPLEKIKIAHANFEAAKDDLEGQKIIAGDALPAYASSKFANWWTNTAKGSDVSMSTITERATRFASGETVPEMGPNPAETIQKWGQSLMASETSARQDLIRQSNAVSPSGRTWRQALGEEETNKKIEGALAPWKTTRDLLTGKAIPLAAANAELATALTDESAVKLFKNKDLGAVSQTYSVVNKYMGPNAGQTFIGQAYGAGLPSDLKKFLDYQKAQIITPRSATTLKAAVDDAADVGIGTPNKDNPTAAVPQSHKDLYSELFATNRFIGDKNIPIQNQLEIAKKFYGPGNEGLVRKFAPDSVDPTTGEYMNGSIDVFRQLYGKPSVIKGMKELGKQDGQSWDMFKTSADKTFVNEVFTPEIKNMETYQNTGYMKILYHADRDDKKFEIQGTPRQYMGSGDMAAIRNAQQSVDRLNKGLEAMTAIAKEDGRDPNAYVLRTMISLGLDPKKTQGIPADLMKAVLSSQPIDPFNTRNSKKNQARVGE